MVLKYFIVSIIYKVFEIYLKYIAPFNQNTNKCFNMNNDFFKTMVYKNKHYTCRNVHNNEWLVSFEKFYSTTFVKSQKG